ncbi:Sigma-70, region 4 [Oceanobacillus limi]|uniref:Sigma-70, region 4 n=1 Tax=Oceanobacillus limi TaxID=930131 RepID=A0A1I0EBP3_9BACI|nr:sigma factor-like helix-turn-helix DNA-binding protein [Oceanobacillus limi]SET42157.1 Sigma-70, region 4 [Oceanobacillus limi]
MGAVSIDIHEKERKLDETYALDSPEGVRLLLSDYHALVKRQYDGDTDAIVILADLAHAIDKARLTWRQKSALHYVFIEDWTQEQTGEALGIAQKNVSTLIDRALLNIAEVFEYWARHDEGYRLTYGEAETE